MYAVEIVNDQLIQIDPATGAGTVVGSLGVGANYAQGMDFDEESGILYWAAYTSSGELRVIDTATGASVSLGAFPGGAETDCLAIMTGGMKADVPWLSESPISGTIPVDGSVPVELTFDAGLVNQPGEYKADLKIKTDSEYGDGLVNVTMNVPVPATWGKLVGTVSDICTGANLEEVSVEIVDGNPITQTWTNENGNYVTWLENGVYDLNFNLEGYLAADGVAEIVAGETTTVDVQLIPDRPCMKVSPDGIEAWVLENTPEYTTEGLQIANWGAQDLFYEITERPVNPGAQMIDVAPKGASTKLAPEGYVPVAAKLTGPNNPLAGTVAVFMDAYPWGSMAVPTILSANGIPYETHSSSEFGSLDFGQFSMIIISGDQPQGFYDTYAGYVDKFEGYVEGGGFLNFFSCDAGWNYGFLNAPLPGGTVWNSMYYENYNVVDDSRASGGPGCTESVLRELCQSRALLQPACGCQRDRLRAIGR